MPPTVQKVYPADGDTGIPVGDTIEIWFDTGIDEQTAKNSIVLFGTDRDTTSGPDQAMWTDENNDPKYFLTSPTFKGYVPIKIELVYWDTTDTTNYAEVSSPNSVYSSADETSYGYGHKVKVTVDSDYAATLAPDTTYTLYINGDPDSTGTGISSRTIYDVKPDSGNTGSGSLYAYGTYEGTTDDVLWVEITDAGNIGTAIYKWWWESAGSGSATTDRVTSRRYRTVEKGVRIRFSGSNLAVGDKWSIPCETISRMTSSYKLSFTTNDGSYSTPPDSPSTPASSTAPSSVLPGSGEDFEVLYMDPANASYNVPTSRRTITVVFSDDVDPTTITDETVKIYKYPVDGYFENSWEPVELQKVLSVSGDTLTITF